MLRRIQKNNNFQKLLYLENYYNEKCLIRNGGHESSAGSLFC